MTIAPQELETQTPLVAKALSDLFEHDVHVIGNEVGARIIPVRIHTEKSFRIVQAIGSEVNVLEVVHRTPHLLHRGQIHRDAFNKDIPGAGIVFGKGRGVIIAIDRGEEGIEKFEWTKAGMEHQKDDPTAKDNPYIQKALQDARRKIPLH